MTIEVGTDPNLPVVLTSCINSSGDLEIKWGTSSLTHPQLEDLRVDTEQLDTVRFQTADFYEGSALHTVVAETINGDDWDDGGTAVTSEALMGDSDPGQLHEVEVTATNTSTNQTKTTTIRLRIREKTTHPLP